MPDTAFSMLKAERPVKWGATVLQDQHHTHHTWHDSHTLFLHGMARSHQSNMDTTPKSKSSGNGETPTMG